MKLPASARSWTLTIAVALAMTLGPVTPARAMSQYGGTILYYDANWNQVGYWYKPCNGNSTRWGVVGVHTVIDDFYGCGGSPDDDCIPTITSDAPVGNLPSPSLVCGVG
jgi:hypothetical protein